MSARTYGVLQMQLQQKTRIFAPLFSSLESLRACDHNHSYRPPHPRHGFCTEQCLIRRGDAVIIHNSLLFLEPMIAFVSPRIQVLPFDSTCLQHMARTRNFAPSIFPFLGPLRPFKHLFSYQLYASTLPITIRTKTHPIGCSHYVSKAEKVDSVEVICEEYRMECARIEDEAEQKRKAIWMEGRAQAQAEVQALVAELRAERDRLQAKLAELESR
ncbi:uncharacterized protein EDB91DRAFT_1245587 [Suillus paluster]|uniref:uncharacterized protein n=1 Tax=Suillus paluster TaxID=48578 RepID=UPI001B85CE48|nr:uncharacterized protein EDB91DRAFT_1245587 [Suillus paluster]KAG1747142.1 hypothetical protein EDB91DRAFT_1245587 [Suillus paluster]